MSAAPRSDTMMLRTMGCLFTDCYAFYPQSLHDNCMCAPSSLLPDIHMSQTSAEMAYLLERCCTADCEAVFEVLVLHIALHKHMLHSIDPCFLYRPDRHAVIILKLQRFTSMTRGLMSWECQSALYSVCLHRSMCNLKTGVAC